MESLMGKVGIPFYSRAELRSMVTCLGEVEERPRGNLTWIETPVDRTTSSREGCVFEGGSLVQRTCIGDIYYGAYWGPTQAWNADGRLVNFSSELICATPSKTTLRLLNTTETQQTASSALAELQQVTLQWLKPTIADVQLSALVFWNASREETEFSQTNVDQTASIIEQVLEVDTKTLANAQRLSNVSSNFLIGIEQILTSSNENKSALTSSSLWGNTAELTGLSHFLFTANSSNLGKLNDTVANTMIIRNTSPEVTYDHHHDTLVVLNVSSLMVNRINASQIAFVYHPNIRLADAAVAAGKTYAIVYSPNPSDGDHDMIRTAYHTANSAMVQVAVEGEPVYNISELVNIYFRPFRAVNTSNSINSVVCASWNPEVNNGQGGWSTQGCSYQGNVSGLDRCKCNHLSSFTSFFAYDGYQPDEVQSLPNRTEEQWVCETGAKYCVYVSSIPKTWFDASEMCMALDGRLPFWTGFEDPLPFMGEAKVTSWSSFYLDAGRWHEFKEDIYSPAQLGHLVVSDAVLRHITKGEHCFAIGSRSLEDYDVRKGISIPYSPFEALGYNCNITLPFRCIRAQAKFNETQRKLELPLKYIIDIEIRKIAGPDPGTEVLRCVPKFKDAFDDLKDRPFNIVWILDGTYNPQKGIEHNDRNTTIIVPYKHFTKYACEVRYLGSMYSNRSQEIEVATPSKGKLGLLIRIRNATFSTSSLDYAQPIKEAINDDPGAFNLSLVGDSLVQQNDSELFIVAYMLSDTFQGRKLTDMIEFEKQIETLNALLNGSFINQNLTFQESTLKNIEYFESLIRDGTLVGVQFFAVDRCPLERSASYFWAGGVGQRVQPSLTGDKPAKICLDEYGYPVTRTCSGSLVSAAQWMEPFSEEQNCSLPSNKSTGTFCRAGYSLTTLAEEKEVYCVKKIPSLSWNNAMESCFGADILTLLELSILPQDDPATWIRNSIDYLTKDNTSDSLMGNLLWLPSRRRVPSGPLYPFMMPSGITKQANYSASNDWEVSLPVYSGSAKKRLSYGDLDPSKLCLAWSVKNRTLTTRECSESHPTVCMSPGHPVGSRKPANFEEQVPFYIPECRGSYNIVADAFGLYSCQKLIKAPTSEGNVSSIFTWEEARMQCEELNNSLMTTLAIPASYALSGNTTKSDYANDSIKRATWFGVRQSAQTSYVDSNNTCRLVKSTNQCAGPIHGFSSDTDFLHGVYVSSSGNGQDSLTLRLPETRLSQAMCQVNFKPAPPAKIPVTYHIKLAWKSSTGTTLKLYLTQEGSLLLGDDWEKMLKHERQFIRLGLVCFGDGILFRTPDVRDNEVMEMYFEFPSHVTSFYCESRTSAAIFMRSNTVLWRRARFTFVVTVRDRRFGIEPETELLRKEDLQGYADLAPLKSDRKRRDSVDGSGFTKSKFVERSNINDKQFRQRGPIDIELGRDISQSGKRKYTVLNQKSDRLVVDSKNYEEWLVRYHVVVNSTAENLTSASNQLRDDMGSIMEELGRPFYYTIEELRSMMTCLEEVEQRPLGNLTWIETPLDKTTLSREGCVFEGGSLVQRTCIGDIYYGAYWGPTQAWNAEGQLVNLSSNFTCTRSSPTTSWLLNITETQQNATSALAELQRVTSKWKPNTADVQLAALIFMNASREETEFSQTNVEQTASIIQQVLNVDTDILASAQRLPNVSTNFLMGIEEILTKTSSGNSTLIASALWGNTSKLEGSSPFQFTANSSYLGESDDTVANTRIIRSTSPAVTHNHYHDALVKLNVSSLKIIRINASQIAFVYHPNIRLADASVAAGKAHAKVYSPNPSDDDHDMLRTAYHTANSAMVQVAVTGGPVYNLSEPVQIYFRPFRAVDTTNSTNSVVCAFWNPEVNNGHGGWSTQGCSYRGSVGGLDHCQCNHLSAFTSFFAYEDYHAMPTHDFILDRVTKVGFGLSIIGCIGVIATYVFFPKWREPKPGYCGHHVIFHLSLALAMLLSTFLGGFDQTSDPNSCLFIAAFLHYLFLVVFFWMLVEAYWHYSFFLRVLGSTTSYFMWNAFLFAWVLPVVPVIVMLVRGTDLYYYTDDKKYCGLKPLGFQYALLPFASLIGLINLVVYILIIVKVGCAKSTVRSTQSKRSFTHYTGIVMFFIMGLSWIFGLLAIGNARIFFSYLFCIFNSLQGFAIFFHFIFRGARSREEWQNFIERISDRFKARDSVLDEARLRIRSATQVTDSETSLSTSTDRTQQRIIGELRNRPQQNSSEYETSTL